MNPIRIRLQHAAFTFLLACALFVCANVTWQTAVADEPASGSGESRTPDTAPTATPEASGAASPRAHATRHPDPLPDLETMIGQMLLVGFRGTTLETDAPILRDIRAGRVGGVILFNRDVALESPVRNIQNPDQVRRLLQTLQAAADIPLLIAVDQEGGRIMRLRPEDGFRPAIPSAAALGGTDDVAVTREVGASVGALLAALGFNVNFAPVVDLAVNPDSPAIAKLERSFSADPDVVIRHATAYIEGLHTHRVLACLKHFPGHGSATADSHLGFTDVTKTWIDAELLPYAALAQQADMVMTAHVFHGTLDPDHPATLSHAIMTGILRERLGFAGVIVTDDMQMKAIAAHYPLEKAVRLAVLAGADILLFGNNLAYDPNLPATVTDILLRAVEDGTIPSARIEASYRRIRALKASRQHMPMPE